MRPDCREFSTRVTHVWCNKRGKFFFHTDIRDCRSNMIMNNLVVIRLFVSKHLSNWEIPKFEPMKCLGFLEMSIENGTRNNFKIADFQWRMIRHWNVIENLLFWSYSIWWKGIKQNMIFCLISFHRMAFKNLLEFQILPSERYFKLNNYAQFAFVPDLNQGF